MRRVAAVMGGQTAMVWLQDGSGRLLNVMQAGGEPSMEVYVRYYRRLDPLLPAVVAAPTATVLTNATVNSPSELDRTEFWTDFARPNGFRDCLQVRMFDAPGASGFFGTGGPLGREPFGAEALRLAHLLHPHLSRALRLQLRLATLGVVGDGALAAVDRLSHGVLVVDGTMRVLHANPAAESILKAGETLVASGRRLTARQSRHAGALRRLVAQAVHGPGTAARSGLLRMERAAGAPLVATVAPLRADHPWTPATGRAAFVLVSDPDRPAPGSLAASLDALYGLTPMEATVAARVGQAETLESAAEALGVKLSTLRSHLLRVFAKTRTSRQAELVRLVAQPGIVAGDGREVG